MSKIYKNILRPILFRISAETAHELGLNSLRIGLGSGFAQNIARRRFESENFGDIERFGLKFSNPLGMAAGFDKNGVVVNQLAALGFGFVEVGTVTYEPQPGNEKPRLFRLPQDRALINRLGFNNQGTLTVAERLAKISPNCVLGVNIGKNKNVPNEEAIGNYLKSFDLVFGVSDYIAVNVSSPNTPDLRELQKAENLEELLGVLQERNRELSRESLRAGRPQDSRQDAGGTGMKPLLVKIAPDLSDGEVEAIVDIALRLNVSGIIATNTTISREGLKTSDGDLQQIGDGGLSGAPLRRPSNQIIRKIYKYSKGKLPIIGVGGIFSAEDAFDKIASGAGLLQAYTGFIYQGAAFAKVVNAGLVNMLKSGGFKDLDEAVGSEVKL